VGPDGDRPAADEVAVLGDADDLERAEAGQLDLPAGLQLVDGGRAERLEELLDRRVLLLGGLGDARLEAGRRALLAADDDLGVGPASDPRGHPGPRPRQRPLRVSHELALPSALIPLLLVGAAGRAA